MFSSSRRRSLVVTMAALLTLASIGLISLSSVSTANANLQADTTPDSTPTTVGVNVDLFLDGALAEEITTEDCTLSGGEVTTCYRITVAGYPADHDTGPFCPETITDSADTGGIWFDGNAVYDLDGEFIENLATTYDDDTWHMYDEDGNVLVTETARGVRSRRSTRCRSRPAKSLR